MNQASRNARAKLATLLAVVSVCACVRKSCAPATPFLGLADATFTCRDGAVAGLASFTWQTKDGEGTLIRATAIDAAQAERRFAQKRFQSESLYREQKSPYPGAVSVKIVCPAEFLPSVTRAKETGGESLRILSAANARKISGVCNASDQVYKEVSLAVYCEKEKAFYELEGFMPVKSAADARTWLNQVRCVND